MKKYFSLFVAALFSVSMMASWTVAGSSTAAFGLAWDPTNASNDMEVVDGLYQWAKTDVTLEAGTLMFKVVKDHSWDESYPDADYPLSIPKDGKYNLTITFNESSKEVTAKADLQEGEVILPPATIKLMGELTDWTNGQAFTLSQDETTAELTINVAETGSYPFKIMVGDGGWRSNAATVSREANTVENLTGNTSSDMTLVADAAGDYTFTWTYETNSLVVTFPEKAVEENPAKFYITGDSALVVNAGLAASKAWSPSAIKSDSISYKLNLAAGDYKLKVTVDGTWETAKGFNDLTYQATGLTDDADKNICFTLAEAGEVSVHYESDAFFLNGNFYVAPAPAKKYYLKNNWNGGEWAWKEMTLEEDGTYSLANVVFGGTGVNINTSESDEGQWWAAAEKISAFDMNTFNEVTLGALDTVSFLFDPEAVNSYNIEVEHGVSAWLIGKYVAPVVENPAKFYITGDSALIANAAAAGKAAWDPAAIKSDSISYKLNLAAGDYKLKVTVDGTWETGKGFSDLTYQATGLTSDADNNICFTLKEAGEVSVHYESDAFFLNGNFYVAPAPAKKYYLKNNWNGSEWAWKEMTLEEDGTYSLANVVFGGTGVNINTSESDEGAWWAAAEKISAFDVNTFNEVTLGALDTVSFLFDPEAVNSYNIEVEHGVSAWLIGKYVAPVVENPAKFYITGDSALVVNAGLDKEQAWNPAAIKSDSISYKLNLAAGDYKLKVTVDGTWETGKGFSDLTYQATGLTDDADNNICFTLAEAGEVSVHYESDAFFLNGNFYVAPAPAKKYYLKNNWNGGEWAWKEMTLEEDGTYSLANVVFGGTGVNINTSESDEGAWWAAAEKISAFDVNTFNEVTLGALDTVSFLFDPEAVNSYNIEVEHGVSAWLIGKYVAPVVENPAKFYITGDGALIANAAPGKAAWDPAAIKSDSISYKMNLAAGDYKLKVTVDGTWETAKGFNDLTWQTDGLTSDADGNICFTLKEAGEVSVHYESEAFFLNGNFYVAPAPAKKYYLKNNWGAEEWSWKEMTLDEQNGYMLGPVVVGGDGINFNSADSDEGSSWITWDEIAAFDANLDPANVEAGDLVVFFFDPEEVNTYTGKNGLSAQIIVKHNATGVDNIEAGDKAVKTIENGQFVIIKNGKVYNAAGCLVK